MLELHRQLLLVILVMQKCYASFLSFLHVKD